MSIKGFTPRIIASPRGMWQSVENRRTGTPSRASACQNMRFRFGTARTRPGTSAVFTSQGKVTGLFNWTTPTGQNLVLYQDGANARAYNQATATSATLASLGGARAPSFAPLDVWAYLCGYDTSSNGTVQCEIFDGLNTDKAFRGAPVITAWAAVDGGAGYCTQGLHNIGFCYQNRTGYTGKPVTGTVYPISATMNVSFAVTATTNASPDVLTLPGHTFTNGDTVTGAGATGDTAINGVFLVAGVAGATLQLTDLLGNAINGNGAYTGGGALTSPDLITAPGNNLQVGQQIMISGATGDTAINGTRLVASTPTPTSTFTLTDTDGNIINSAGAYTGGATVTSPIQFTTQAGDRAINISVTLPAQPDGGTDANGNVQATLFLIGTAQNNPNLWYFIPTNAQTGQIGEQPVPLNAPVTLNFVFSMSDFDINATLSGDTAQANFLFLAQDANGNGPFNPRFVVAYGNRMCYGAGTTLYASDLQAPQQIAADTNGVVIPNQRNIGYAFPLPGSTNLYLTGLGFTGYVTDNSDSPSTWPEPVIISDVLGAQYPNLVCFDTQGPWVWIVTPTGPYLFDGAYEGMPLTYLVSGLNEQQQPIGWSRVNWAAAYAIQIKDDVANFKLYVAAPLDGATECNYLFTIDYRLGRTFDSVDISLDVFSPQFFSSIGIVREIANDKENLWFGPSAAGNVTRFDVATHDDIGGPIDNYWISGLAREGLPTSMIRVGAFDFWVRGNIPVGDYQITLYGPDGVKSVPITICSTQGVPSTVTTAPGIKYMAKTDLSKIEDWYIEFRTNSPGVWQELSGLTGYERQDLYNR